MSVVNKTEDVLNEIIEGMRVNASVKVSQDETTVDALIEGEDAGILIGRDGRTLDALQLITNIIVNKGAEDRVHVLIDIEGYKDRRKENLEQLAQSLAEKVIKEEQPVNMEPMNAYDRRVVHMILRESTQVITESVGEGRERHIVIKLL